MKKNVFVALSIVLMMSCGTKHHMDSHHMTNDHKAGHEIHWSYTGEGNPSNWSHISGEYKACDGSTQSPIDIKIAETKLVSAKHILKVNYNRSKVNIVNNGHTEQFNVNEGNDLTFDGKNYKLKQFHMHSLSEHTIDGKHAPLEVHFVNKAEDNTYAVIGVLFEEGEASPFFDRFLKHLPKVVGDYGENSSFDIHDMLPSTAHYYHYSGSFTTPPCTEVVEWIVLTDRLTASKKQLANLHRLLSDNYRPVQAVNERVIDVQ